MAVDDPSVTAETLSVSQVNQAVGAALADAFPGPFWVAGEVQGYERDAARAGQRRWGQVYFELVEKEDGADAAKASVKALMWGDAGRRVAQRLGDLRLADGLKVKFLCAVDFYWPRASLQLKVLDVDPDFTVGDLEKARRELVDRLKRDGLTDANQAVPMPLAPRGIGLITSEGSAAYHDFMQELRGACAGFSVFLADARMQGEETESAVVRAIALLEAHPEVEVIALARGGGSRSDLLWFDRERIALAVARCKKPVITGIGHEIDLSVADLVAHASHKTPTACARFLCDRVRAFSDGVAAMREGLAVAFRDRLSVESAALSDAVQDWRRLCGLRLQEAAAGLTDAGPRMRRAALSLCRTETERLAASAKELSLKDPSRLLERGYSLLYAEGKLLKSAASVGPGRRVDARLKDGVLEATVTAVRGNR